MLKSFIFRGFTLRWLCSLGLLAVSAQVYAADDLVLDEVIVKGKRTNDIMPTFPSTAIGIDAEEANATAESFESIDDESFDKIVALWKKKGSKKEDMKKKEERKFKATDEDLANFFQINVDISKFLLYRIR